jgi:hypothetical protein
MGYRDKYGTFLQEISVGLMFPSRNLHLVRGVARHLVDYWRYDEWFCNVAYMILYV